MIALSIVMPLLLQVQFAPAPPAVAPRNEVERLVLARPESASRELEQWLAGQLDHEARDSELIAAGFRRVRPNDACANYVYTRQLTSSLVRGASIIMCGGKPPFVMRSDEVPGALNAPKSGQQSVRVPSAPR